MNDNVEIQHRGCFVVRNLIGMDKTVAETLMQGQMMEVLMALSLVTEPDRQGAKECAEQALDYAVQHGIIKPQKDES